MSDAAKPPQPETNEWEAAAAHALGSSAAAPSGRVFLLRCRPGLILLLGAVITVLILNSIGLIFMSSSLHRLHETSAGEPVDLDRQQALERSAAALPDGQGNEEGEHDRSNHPGPGDPLAAARKLVDQGAAREAAVQLEALGDSGKLSFSDRFEASLLLARVYKSLGNQEKAFSFARKAADDVVGELPTTQLFRAAETLLERGEVASARKMFYSFLARADKLEKEQQFLVPLAEFRVADCFGQQAARIGARP
ncbi:MAG: hypothetical protein U1E76_10730 [Planctomycetota bacterium]